MLRPLTRARASCVTSFGGQSPIRCRLGGMDAPVSRWGLLRSADGVCAGGDPAAYVYLGDVNVETAHRARGMRKFRVSFGEQAPTDLWPPR